MAEKKLNKEQLEAELAALKEENKQLKKKLESNNSPINDNVINSEAGEIARDDKVRAFEKFRARAEKIISESDNKVTKQTDIDLKQALQELEINQIELELQNEELLTTQNILLETSGKFEQLYNKAPVGYFVIDRKGSISSPNNTICNLLHYSPKELSGFSFANLVFQEDRYLIFDFFKKLFPSKEKQGVEVRLVDKFNKPLPFFIEGVQSISDDFKTRDFFITATDISDMKKAQRNVKESYERLNLAMSAAQLAHWEWYYQSQKIFLSTQRSKTLQLANTSSEISFDQWVDRIHQDDVDSFMENVELLSDPAQQLFETRYRMKYQSGYRWLWEKGRVIERNENSEPVRIIGITIDITEEILTEQELNRFKQTLDKTLDAVFMFSERTLNYFYANKGALSLCGFSPNELYKKTPLDLLPELNKEEFFSLIDTLKKGELPVLRLETLHKKFDATKRHVSLMLQYLPSMDEDGRFIMILRDISREKEEKEKLERAYEQLEERVIERTKELEELNRSLKAEIEEREIAEEKISFQSLLLDQVDNAVIFTDTDGKIKYWNKGAENIYGWKSAEVIGKSIYQVTVPTPLVNDSRIIMDSMKESGTWRGKFEVRRKNGTLFKAVITLTTIKNWKGKEIGTVGISHDISDWERSQEELEQAKQIAEAANRVKSEFLANVSHELRTPLNGVLGFTQVMQRDPDLQKKHRNNLAVIERSGKQLLHLINDILDFSQIESNMKKPLYADFNLSALLKGIASLISAKAASKSIAFHFLPDESIPKFFHGDEKIIHQVLINLLDNAVKFTAKGSITFSAKLLDNNKIRFEVRDTGIGIKPDMLKTVFLPFRQSLNVYSKSQGTGLGLSISKRLIELINSELHVESSLQKGSRFWFDLEVTKLKHKNYNLPDIDNIIGTENKTPDVFIADALTDNSKFLGQYLTSLGFTVSSANTKSETESILNKGRPDLAIIDIDNDELGGLSVIQELVTDNDNKTVKIIAAAEKPSEQLSKKAAEAGADVLVTRPYDTKELLSVIDSLLSIEWKYNGNNINTFTTQEQSIYNTEIPPRETLELFLKHTLIGDIRSIHKLIDSLSIKNSKYEPFLEHIRFLAQNYEMEQIHKTIQGILENNG